jgi:hypothetical protein
MKTTRAKTEAVLLDDIVKTLKRLPRARLGAVRAVVQALAATEPAGGQSKTRPRKKGSLVDSPFCGMWKDREDIADGQTFARQLREMVETRGDRRTNAR